MDLSILRKLEQRARVGALTDDERRSYERSLKAYRDNLAVEGGVEYRLRVTREKSLAEGRAEGRAKGRAEGRAEGRAQERRDMAKAMLQNGVDINFISKMTGFSPREIENFD